MSWSNGKGGLRMGMLGVLEYRGKRMTLLHRTHGIDNILADENMR